jgi:hypothetical protein
VSPAARAAFEEFRAGAAAGRITAESFAASRTVGEPVTITPTVIELKPFVIDVVEIGTPSADPDAPVPSSALPDKTRSLL